MKLQLYSPVLKKLVRVPKGSWVQTPCHKVIEGREGTSQEMALEAYRTTRAGFDSTWGVVEPDMVL